MRGKVDYGTNIYDSTWRDGMEFGRSDSGAY